MIDFRRIYAVMLSGRSLDEEMRKLYDRDEPMLRHFLYSGKGQEGAAAIAALLQKDDYMFPHPYRGFTHLIAKGVPLEKIVGEYLGKKTGMLEGFGDVGGFYFYPECGIVGVSTILGGNFAMVCGVAEAAKRNGDNKIVAIFFGDGEASRSTFGAALSLASLWHLPILFVCENNGLSLTTPVAKTSATPRVADRANGYNVQSHTFDDGSIVDLMTGTQKIIEEVRTAKRPALIEVLTPRFGGHTYKEEQYFEGMVRTTLRHDPLAVFEKELQDKGLLARADMDELRRAAAEEVRRIIAEASVAPQASYEDFKSFYHE